MAKDKVNVILIQLVNCITKFLFQPNNTETQNKIIHIIKQWDCKSKKTHKMEFFKYFSVWKEWIQLYLGKIHIYISAFNKGIAHEGTIIQLNNL